MHWCVYMILCSDDTLYTGITCDVVRRYRQHAQKQGAKYFRGRSPKSLVYVESGHDHGSAARREIIIKKLSRGDKLQLIGSIHNQIEGFLG